MLVHQKIQQFNLNGTSLLFDPFLGSGTTCLAAKEKGIKCVGIEAHDFVSDIAEAKLFWDYDMEVLREELDQIIETKIFDGKIEKEALEDYAFTPELVKKCFSEQNLVKLLKLKHAITGVCKDKHDKNFFNLALTATLRLSSTAGTGWPYIAPSKYQGKKNERDGIVTFKKTVLSMISDIKDVKDKYGKGSECLVIHGDSRREQNIARESVDLAITSPPYLNNFDYADRTRLETYFFGIAKNWSDITAKFRDKLIVAATTQVHRTDFDPDNCMDTEFKKTAPELGIKITEKVKELSKMRLQKGGKKSYDIMVSQYFNDILPIIKNTYRYLKEGGVFVLVLGDSAPYGVHIPTEQYIAELGKAIGFKSYDIEELRTRGGKWPMNPQRHSVPLRESILTLTK